MSAKEYPIREIGVPRLRTRGNGELGVGKQVIDTPPVIIIIEDRRNKKSLQKLSKKIEELEEQISEGESLIKKT